MSDEKIAEGIIIRVGGGIREVHREVIEDTESLESVHRKPEFEQTEDVPPFEVELGSKTKIGPDKTIN